MIPLEFVPLPPPKVGLPSYWRKLTYRSLRQNECL